MGLARYLPDALRQWRERSRALRALQEHGWKEPLPGFLKVTILKSEARAFRANVFVETGTFLGDTTDALRDEFERLYTIEVHPQLHARATRRFARDPRIRVLLGDSAKELARVLGEIGAERRVMFWLDGHYSGEITGRGASDCPVVQELEAIAASRLGPVKILIDDYRLFGTDPAYPSVAQLAAMAERLFGERASLRIANDIAVITREA